MTNKQGYVAYQLREMMKQDAIPSVFTDPNNPDDFIAGFVRAAGTKTCVMESVGPYGRFDGWFAIRLGCIVEVSMDGQYAERLLRMLDINGDSARGLPDDEQPWVDGDGVLLMLRHAHRHNRVITTWTASEAFTGFVDRLDDLYVTLLLLDFMGAACGEFKIKLPDIELCSLCSEEELMYEKLNVNL